MEIKEGSLQIWWRIQKNAIRLRYFGNERARELKFQRAISQRPKANRGRYVSWLDILRRKFSAICRPGVPFGIIPKDIQDAGDSVTEKGNGEEREREGGEAGDEAGREDRVIYCKQYYRRHAVGAEEWEKPVSLVPEMYFIATEDGGSPYNGDPAYYSLSGRHWI